MTTSTQKSVARLISLPSLAGPALAGLALLLSGPAMALKMTSGFSGSWYDPTHNGQGFLIEVLAPESSANKADGKATASPKAVGNARALVYFYTFNELGERLWLVGMDEVSGTGASITLYEGEIADFDPEGPIDEPDFSVWGTLDLDFDNCDQGTADLTQNVSQGGQGGSSKIQIGTGRLNIFRLSTVQAKRCSGGISDDIDPLEPPMVVEDFFSSADASGRLRLDMGPDGAEFLVDVRDAEPGEYDIEVDGVPVGRIQIGTGRRGRFSFGGPGADVPLLDFDPRAKQIRLVGDTTLDLGNMGTDGMTPNLGGMAPSFQPFALGRQLAFEVSGMDFSPPVPNFTAVIDASHNVEGLRADFRIEVMGPPAGEYDVVVNGSIHGRVVVEDTPIGTFGSVSYSSPDSAGRFPLDFEPRGAMIDFSQEGFVLFSFEFPFLDD